LERCIGDDTYIELRGGSEVMLAAVGAVIVRHGLPVFRVDAGKATPEAVRGSLPPLKPRVPKLKYEELLVLLNSKIGTESEDLSIAITDELKEVVTDLGKEYLKAPREYNRYNGRLISIVNKLSIPGTRHSIFLNKNGVDAISTEDFQFAAEYIKILGQLGVLRVMQCDEKGIVYDYADKFRGAFVEKSGILLETMARIAAIETGRFSDVRQGVKLDWDGVVEEDGSVKGTCNEVDLILVDKLTVYYVSCKSGGFDKDALYELESVAHGFDTGNVKKVLLCDEIDPVTKNRANEMHIRVMCDIEGIGDLQKRLRKL